LTAWPKDELKKIAETDDLHIAPFREDGKTYGTPTWIWSVVVDDSLYVRPYNGQKSRWYKAALRQKSGRITAAGMTKLGIQKQAIIRVRAGVSYALTEAMDEGHCGLPVEEVVGLTVKLIDVPPDLIHTALALELDAGELMADTVEGQRCVFLAGLYRRSWRISSTLGRCRSCG
jgi:hypothetical protein